MNTLVAPSESSTVGRIAAVAAVLAAALWLWPLGSADVEAQASSADASAGTAADGGVEGNFFVEAVDVNVVNVEVYVTDRSGNRITGLTKDDFVLEVDKSPVAISNFYAVEGGRAINERPEVIEVTEPVEAEAEAEPAAPSRQNTEAVAPRPRDQRLYLIVYVDNFNLLPFSRNKVLRQARNFLRSQVRPGDEVMLVSYDRSLKIRHPFTKDPEIISSALYELEELTGHRVHYDSDRRDILSQIYDDAENIYEVRGRVSQYAESIHNDMAFTLDAMGEQVEMLAGLPGRKAILYVANGLPMRAGEDVFYALNDKFRDSTVLMDSQRYDLSRRFQSLIARANTNRVTFYTVDAAGLRSYSFMDASNATAGGGAQIDQVHFTNLQSPLLFLAEETGGFAMINTNNFNKGLNKMAEDFDTYYSLGFLPAGGEKVGRYHRIKVKLKNERRGVRIRHREGYRDKPIGTRMSDTALAALHFGFQENELGIEIDKGLEKVHESGQFLVPLVVKVPIGKLTFLESRETQRGRIRLWVAAKDSEGGLAEVQQVPVPIDIPSGDFSRAQEQYYHYQLTLLMRKGRQLVSVGVRDEIGATTGFALKPVTIGG
ncbi:MAG: VWA domain-containing protein [Acidobacteriota bacterium]